MVEKKKLSVWAEIVLASIAGAVAALVLVTLTGGQRQHRTTRLGKIPIWRWLHNNRLSWF